MHAKRNLPAAKAPVQILLAVANKRVTPVHGVKKWGIFFAVDLLTRLSVRGIWVHVLTFPAGIHGPSVIEVKVCLLSELRPRITAGCANCRWV